jgi:hypothetical protein
LTVRRPFGPSQTNSAPSAIIEAGQSAAGSAWASEPPMVPRFRTWGSPTTPATSDSTGILSFTTRDDSIW